jgi:hypothetical protein
MTSPNDTVLSGGKEMVLSLGLEAAHWRTAALMMLATASVLVARQACATETAPPSGHITLAREVPARNAFRPGGPGKPTTVATSREEVVVENTRWAEAGPGSGIQALPDSALDATGTPAPSALLHATNSLANTMLDTALVAPGTSPARSMQALGGAMQAVPGIASARGPIQAGGVFSTVPGLK